MGSHLYLGIFLNHFHFQLYGSGYIHGSWVREETRFLTGAARGVYTQINQGPYESSCSPMQPFLWRVSSGDCRCEERHGLSRIQERGLTVADDTGHNT